MVDNTSQFRYDDDIPLVVSRKLDHWIYDVVGEETLHFSFGPVATLHVKPRREADAGDMSAEIWFAPTLQYLPVRIRINQGSEIHLDLLVDRIEQK